MFPEKSALWVMAILIFFPIYSHAGLEKFQTDLSKKIIDLSELNPGGPGKDGIPSIDNPRFISVQKAAVWLKGQEPVIALEFEAVAKAYPLQILMWHEIVNDVTAQMPVVVTFCPLCYSAIVFERRIDEEILSFGVSGYLRHSDLVMYDRETESLWQQFTGQALVGDYTERKLKRMPAQIISFKQFRDTWPEGIVLSRDTGVKRPYGENPYSGYDDIRKRPFMYRGEKDDRLEPMEKVIAITIGKTSKAYPYSVTQKAGVVRDVLENVEIVVFHDKGAVSALDHEHIADSKQAGSTGVFSPILNGKSLTFHKITSGFKDTQTQSTWNITGKAIDGTLKGEQLDRIVHGDYFAFAWLVFKPQTQIYRETE